MTILEEKAEKVFLATPNLQNSSDPAIREFSLSGLLLTIEIIVAAVKLYKACKQTPQDALDTIQSHSFIDSIKSRRLIKKVLRKRNLHVSLMPTLFSNFVTIGKTMTLDEMSKIFEEAENIYK